MYVRLTTWVFTTLSLVFVLFTAKVKAQTTAGYQKLLAEDGSKNDSFEESVAVTELLAIIGGPFDDDLGPQSGSAYVFQKDGFGDWNQVAKLLAPSGTAGEKFGFSVALFGSIALIGASGDGYNGVNTGSAYLFERLPGGIWVEIQKLVASDGSEGDLFGSSVALSGDVALIGAFGVSDSGAQTGAVYVFIRQQLDDRWIQTQRLTARDGGAYDRFGFALAISGALAMVGADGDDSLATNAGSVYVFASDADNSWTVSQKLLAKDGEAGDRFGFALAISDSVLVIGADLDDTRGSDTGSAYIFIQQTDGGWIEAQKLEPVDSQRADQFGHSVSVSEGAAIVTAILDDNDAGRDAGSAYVYVRQPGGAWTLKKKYRAPDGSAGDFFGTTVSCSGLNIFIGATGDDDNGSKSGSTYALNLSYLIDPVSVTGYTPRELTLSQNIPNPFNPTTAITFFTVDEGNARLVIFDLTGQTVRTLLNGHVTAGNHTVRWDGLDQSGSQVASGVFLYRLVSGNRSIVRRMVLVK